MTKAVHEFVSACAICQQAKPDRSKLPGLLQPLPVPDRAWKVLSIDFIKGLPLSGSVNCILVVVDVFSKYSHFLGLKHPFTAESVAKLFFSQVFKLHGMPQAIVSDRDRIFTSKLWQELFKLAKVELRMSTAYHPQSDGQTERVNQCLETFLRCYAHACPKQWSSWLDLAEYWYNTSFHSAVGCSPFEVMYGYAPGAFGIEPVQNAPVTDLSSWLADRSLNSELIKQHLLRAKQRMKKNADLHRSEHKFEIHDWVYLKLQPYVQSSLADRSHHKLAFRFFGPYRVVAKVGSVAYRLELPPSSQVHPVFHVSQLKKAVGAHHTITALPPSDSAMWSVPEAILQRRLLRQGTSSIMQGLIKWSHLPESLATWEQLEDLRQQFPRARIWVHPGAQEPGSVS